MPKSKTYRATQSQLIDGYRFAAGDIVGTGNVGEDVGAGTFTPDESCPRVSLGMIQSRLHRGLVTDGEVAEPQPEPTPDPEPTPEPDANGE